MVSVVVAIHNGHWSTWNSNQDDKITPKKGYIYVVVLFNFFATLNNSIVIRRANRKNDHPKTSVSGNTQCIIRAGETRSIKNLSIFIVNSLVLSSGVKDKDV